MGRYWGSIEAILKQYWGGIGAVLLLERYYYWSGITIAAVLLLERYYYWSGITIGAVLGWYWGGIGATVRYNNPDVPGGGASTDNSG